MPKPLQQAFIDGPTLRLMTREELSAPGSDKLSPAPLRSSVKRVVDVFASAVGLILCSPLFLVIAAFVVLDSPGPIVYRARRVGFGGKEFECLKFRTMHPNAEEHREQIAHLNERGAILFKIANDPRITKAGALLRKYSLDELPQLWNVLRGEMSLVGPRPPLPAEVARYEREHLQRLTVRPGMTGLWQVYAREDPSFERYIALDTVYIENWSLLLDLRILVRTTGVVVRGTGS